MKVINRLLKSAFLLSIVFSSISTKKVLSEDYNYQSIVERNAKEFIEMSSPEFVKMHNMAFKESLSQKDFEDFYFHTQRLFAQCGFSNGDAQNVGYWQKQIRDIYRDIARQMNWTNERIESIENNREVLNKAIDFVNLKGSCSPKNASLILSYRTPDSINNSIKSFNRLSNEFMQKHMIDLSNATESEAAELRKNFSNNYTKYISNIP